MPKDESNLTSEKSLSVDQPNMETECISENNENKFQIDDCPAPKIDSSVLISRDSERDITNILNLGHAENREDTVFAETSQAFNESVASGTSSSFSSKQRKLSRKKTGHVRKRKWRPLWKLTRKERDKLYERERKRIQREKEELKAAGVALAPHNTSEFLIEDRGLSSLDDEEFHATDPFDKEFNEIYESVSYNLYDNMSKFELVERWIEAEDRNEALEKQLKAVREKKRLLGLSGNDVESQMTKIEVFKEEIKKLVIENEELQRKNEKLKKYLMNSE